MGAGAFRRRRRVFGHLYHPHLLVNSRRAIDLGPGKDPHVLLFVQEDGDSFYRNERNHLLAVVFGHFGWHYYQRYRERELQAAELGRELVEARLDALRLQLNPHFLFTHAARYFRSDS